MAVPSRPTGVSDNATAVFEEHRRYLFAIAYRMLGSASEAEDAVQDAYLRWEGAERAEVEDARAYLARTVTRLCIDQLRSARARREVYVGPWLPEPLVTEPDPAAEIEEADSLSMAFLVLLESLSPVERAAFLLHDVFGYEYEEVASVIDKSEVNARQIATRARKAIAARRPRFEPDRARRDEVVARFLAASGTGDMDALISVLAEDVTVWSDGGGKAPAARKPVTDRRRVARFLVNIVRKEPPDRDIVMATVNGQPGIVAYKDEAAMWVLVLEIADGAIHDVRIVANPDKLKKLGRGVDP